MPLLQHIAKTKSHPHTTKKNTVLVSTIRLTLQYFFSWHSSFASFATLLETLVVDNTHVCNYERAKKGCTNKQMSFVFGEGIKAESLVHSFV